MSRLFPLGGMPGWAAREPSFVLVKQFDESCVSSCVVPMSESGVELGVTHVCVLPRLFLAHGKGRWNEASWCKRGQRVNPQTRAVNRALQGLRLLCVPLPRRWPHLQGWPQMACGQPGKSPMGTRAPAGALSPTPIPAPFCVGPEFPFLWNPPEPWEKWYIPPSQGAGTSKGWEEGFSPFPWL